MKILGHSVLLCVFSFLRSSTAQSGTCSESTDCTSGCCSTSGYCGFGPEFCGEGNCTSTCDAQAECGQYAPAGSELCPLNVCCSEYGFCGTTSDFCDTGCQSNCDAPTAPSCSGSSSTTRTIGYYESWSSQRTCDSWQPSTINAKLWTHINYAFALIDSSSYKISAMNSYDTDLYTEVTDLKRQNSALKVFIAVGGWSAGGQIFSDMVSTAANRESFITSAVQFMKTYAFDGIDIDWEYPAASDRGGVAADTANYVTFLKELKTALGSTYGISATLPSSYWYLQGFDVAGMEPYVDWFNFMSYDIHGTWDGDSPYTEAIVQPHTNLTEITAGLELLWRNDISPTKVVLGLGFYGRSFTLSDPSCKTPGCAFSGGGNAGECTATSGILSNAEIQRVISQYSLTPTLDETAAVKYMSWDSDQWVSYDDSDTYALKRTYANNHCLGGTMVWALDLDDPSTSESALNSVTSESSIDSFLDLSSDAEVSSEFATEKYTAFSSADSATRTIYWTDCSLNPTCPYGFDIMTYGHGKVFDADLKTVTAEGCHGGPQGSWRALCIQSNMAAKGCAWRGRPKQCSDTCPTGTFIITANSQPEDSKTGCGSGKFSAYCCESLTAPATDECPATYNSNQLGSGLSIRQAGSFTGGKTDLTECEAWEAAANAVAVGGALILVSLAGYWLNGIYHAYAGWTGATTTSTKLSQCPASTTTTVTAYDIYTRTCDADLYPQACHHYNSVISRAQGEIDTLICSPTDLAATSRKLPKLWDQQHNSNWYKGYTAASLPRTCERDEYPPYAFNKGTDGKGAGWIRFVPQADNNGAGKLWKSICVKKNFKSERVTNGGQVETTVVNGKSCVRTWTTTTHYTTTPAMSFVMDNLKDDDSDLMDENGCWPSPVVPEDYAFVLFTQDEWYAENIKAVAYYDPQPDQYSKAPGAYTKGIAKTSKVRRRSLDEVSPDEVFIDEGNTTRRATDEELEDMLGIVKCKEESCADVLVPRGFAALDVPAITASSEVQSSATSIHKHGYAHGAAHSAHQRLHARHIHHTKGDAEPSPLPQPSLVSSPTQTFSAEF